MYFLDRLSVNKNLIKHLRIRKEKKLENVIEIIFIVLRMSFLMHTIVGRIERWGDKETEVHQGALQRRY